MANSTVAFGLVPLRKRDGSPFNSGSIQKMFVAAADSVKIFVGDLVKHVTMVTTNNTLNLPTVAQYAAGDTNVAGVVVAVEAVDGVAMGSENFVRLHRPASTAMYVHVITDPNVIFKIRCDNGGAALAGADLLENADIVVGSGDTVTGMSAAVVDSSTHATTATLPLRLLRFYQGVDNTPAANDTIAEVILNTIPNRTTTGTAL